jgi:ectoine hydroxylase-related dioxygenase (phytanoyl-CoA dioxygenase family)
MNDLAIHHHLVSELFENPSAETAWKQFCLSDDQVAFFEEYGYLKGLRILTDAQVTALREQLNYLMSPECAGNPLWYEHHSNESANPDTILFHALGAWRIALGFHDLLWNPAFTVKAAQLLGGNVRFWHDQLFCKPAHHGGVVAWHQDYSYWTRTKPMAHLTCHIALDDATPENGCMYYVPGSHQWNLLPITGLAGDMNAVQNVLTEEQREQFRPIAVDLKAGECAFHHPLMMHGSMANKSNRSRRATVINVFRDGVRSDSNETLLKGVPSTAAGEKMAGQFFPLLFDASIPAD